MKPRELKPKNFGQKNPAVYCRGRLLHIVLSDYSDEMYFRNFIVYMHMFLVDVSQLIGTNDAFVTSSSLEIKDHFAPSSLRALSQRRTRDN